MAYSFNVTGSRPTLDRWKHKEADKLNFKELIEKLKLQNMLLLQEQDRLKKALDRVSKRLEQISSSNGLQNRPARTTAQKE